MREIDREKGRERRRESEGKEVKQREIENNWDREGGFGGKGRERLGYREGSERRQDFRESKMNKRKGSNDIGQRV